MSLNKEHYEVLIGRLKLLSKMQTAFLKSHLSRKIAGVTKLVEQSIKCLETCNGSNKKDEAEELRKAILLLKLQELDVDEAAKDIELSKELHILRNATNNEIGGFSDTLPVGNADVDSYSKQSAAKSTPPVVETAPLSVFAMQSEVQSKAESKSESVDFLVSDVSGIGNDEQQKQIKQIKQLQLQYDDINKKYNELIISSNLEINKKNDEITNMNEEIDLLMSETAEVKEKDNEDVKNLKELNNDYKKQLLNLQTTLEKKNKEIINLNESLILYKNKNNTDTDTQQQLIIDNDNNIKELKNIIQTLETNIDNIKSENLINIEKLTTDLTTKAEIQFKDAMNKADDMVSKALAENDKNDDKHQDELNKAVTNAINKTNNENNNIIQKLKDEYEIKINNSIKETEIRMEAEKDELMEAMAQEVEDIETSKDDIITNKDNEILSLTNTNNTIANDNKELNDNNINLKLKLKDSNKLANDKILKLINSLSYIKSNVIQLQNEKNKILIECKNEMSEYINEIKNNYNNNFLIRLKNIQKDLISSQQRYQLEYMERRKLHNIIQELKGNIRVYMRCRPPSSEELQQYGDESICVNFPNNSNNHVTVFNNQNREKTWEFDSVFNYDSKQEDVYKDVSQLVQSVMDGYNVCIFAYGQTGSGKTYTMQGPPTDRGVNTRALEDLFDSVNKRRNEFHDVITISLLEVYNEEIRDLLVNGGGHQDKLEIRQSPEGNYVPGLTSIEVENLTDVDNLLILAERNRSTATTNMNQHSSRSHMMMSISIYTEQLSTGNQIKGKLNLVDLAGSERINKSGATGQTLKEAQNINKSLSALSDVIAARGAKQNHVPFRNSTLTYLLQDSLSKDSKTLMICCCSPILASSDETISALNFASRVSSVELGKATKNTTQTSGKKR
jgi:kinesin family member C2/C3